MVLTAFCGLLSLAAPQPIDQAALQRLIERCQESRSWGLVVFHEGKTIVQRNFGTRAPACNLMSATKSITALAIGFLIEEGKLQLETPLHQLFPEYTGPLKSKVTVRHLLEHTSGIKTWDNEPLLKLENLHSRVKDALDAPIVSEPGKEFAYNNRATNLLSGVVRKASGKKMDEYLREKLFSPLGVEPFWFRDKAGDPHGCAELYMTPADMAKVGQLVLDQGKWNGKQILSPSFITEMTTDKGYGAGCGWLWWIETKLYGYDKFLQDQLQAIGASPALTKRLSPLLGRWFDQEQWAMMALAKQAGTDKVGMELYEKAEKKGFDTRFLGEFQTVRKDPPAYAAKGWGGQFIVVIPESKIVAVRTCGWVSDFSKDPFRFEMGDFIGLVRALDPKFNE